MKSFLTKAVKIIFISTVLVFLYSPTMTASLLPDIKGKIIFHTCKDYDSWDSELKMVDLDKKTVTAISQGLDVVNSMYADFSPDGNMVTFMADDKTDNIRNWDIFTYNFTTKELNNLTGKYFIGTNEENPAFSPDGKKILFKSTQWRKDRMVTCDLYEINLNNNSLKRITNDIETKSSPCYSTDGKTIFFTQGSKINADIYSIDLLTGIKCPIAATFNTPEYSPSIFGTNSVVFSRVNSNKIKLGQLFIQTGSKNPIPLPTNKSNEDHLGFCQIDSKYFFFSRTGKDTKGGYDIFIGDIGTGATHSLDNLVPGCNTKFSELGTTYYIPQNSNGDIIEKVNLNKIKTY